MKVNCTGSTAVGSSIAALCGMFLRPCLMEYGGKDCSIVCDGADIDNAVKWCVIGSFHHVRTAPNISRCSQAIRMLASRVEDATEKGIQDDWPADIYCSNLLRSPGRYACAPTWSL